MPRQIRLDATQEGSARFDIHAVYPVITDQGICHGHNLALIRGVCQDLLISCHAGIEENLTRCLSFPCKGVSIKYSPVF